MHEWMMDGQVPGQIGMEIEAAATDIAMPAISAEVGARTPDLIAHEINEITGNMKRALLNGYVQIGIRMGEAKQMVPHGEWEEWVTAHTEFSMRQAQNMMQLAKEYSTRLDTFGQLSISQATLLLGLAEDEQEQLARDHKDDTIAELKAAIAEIKAEKDKMQVRMDKMATDLESAADAARDEKEEAEAVIRELRAKIDSAASERSEYLDKYRDAMKQAQELEAQLNDPGSIPESAKTELANLRKEADQAYEKADRFMANAQELKSENAELQKKLREAEENLRKAEQSTHKAEQSMDETSAAKIKAEAVIRDIASGIPEMVKKIRAQVEVLGDGRMAVAVATLLRNAAAQLEKGGGQNETA